MRLLIFSIGIYAIIEVALLILISKWVGLWPVFITILFTSLIGVIIIQRIGKQTAVVLQQSRIPGAFGFGNMMNRISLFAAAVLLITPGFIANFIALLLIFPPTRGLLQVIVEKVFKLFLSKKFLQHMR